MFRRINFFAPKAVVGFLIFTILFAGLPGGILQRYFSDRNVVDRSFNLRTAHANPGTRSNTVSFFIGTFASNGSTNFKSMNATNTLPDSGGSFQIRLMESNVSITDAFVDWTVHFNASGTATQANSLFEAFDACSSPCAPDAWSGSGAALQSNTTDYFSNSGESNVANFKQEVSSESQLAAYTGGGAILDAQFGYCIGTAATCTGAAAVAEQIGYATGVLYVTYTYDDTSSNITNTIVYPLESTVSTDAGSKKSSQAASCTLGSNCPKFNYNMELPEFSSGNQLSQWFALNGTGNSTGVTNYSMTARIGTNAQSAAQVFAEARSANDFGMRFQLSGLTGYAENTTSTLERTGTGNAMYTLGGEAFETYAASSSAGTKTRTIGFPLGELCMQQTTSTCAATVNLSFPEGGVTIKKAWTRVTYSVSNTTAATLTIGTKIDTNATTTNIYNIANISLGVVQMDYIYDVIASSSYAQLAAGTPASPVPVTISTTYSAARGATGGEFMVTYTYTGESGGYNVPQILFAGNSDTDNNKTAWSAASGLIAPAIPETTGVSIVRAGLLASLLAMDSDSAVPADHGGTANTQMSIGAALSTGACTASYTSIPDTVTEVNDVYFYKNVTATITSSTTQTYTPCYTDRDFTSDTTAGFQVSGMFILLYRVVISGAGGNPTVSAVQLNGGSAVTLTSNTTTAIAVIASTTDPGGPGNISYATGTIYRTSLGANCAADSRNCYQLASSSCAFSGSTSTVTCTANIQYFADSTGNASSSYPSDSWTGAITVTNATGGTGTATSSAENVNVLSAINVTTSSISFGTLAPGVASAVSTTTVTNAGNSSSTLKLSATTILTTGSRTIPADYEHYATSSFVWGGSEPHLSTTSLAVSGFTLAAPTTTTNVQGNIFWALQPSLGTPTGTYTGANQFTAVFSP